MAEKKQTVEQKLLQNKMPRLDSSTEFNTYLISPVVPDLRIDQKTKKLRGNEFHKFITKDLAVSYFPHSKFVFLVNKYFSLIMDFVFLGVPQMAKIYDAELKALTSALRSVDGFERDMLTRVTIAKKDQESREGKLKKGRWFR